jgi:predicted nucleic acid-binding protein
MIVYSFQTDAAVTTSQEVRLRSALLNSTTGAEELGALQRYADERCIELNNSGVTNDCPDHCDVVLTDDELAVGRAALERAKQRRSRVWFFFVSAVFFDVNVYIDAIVYWNTGNDPANIIFDNDSGLVGPPAALLIIAVRDQAQIQGESIVLHASDHILIQLASVLATKYKWSEEAVDLALDFAYRLIEGSGGHVIEEGPTTPNLQPDDPEDNRVLGDALATPAKLLITSDQNFRDLGPYAGLLFLTPPEFLRALNRR